MGHHHKAIISFKCFNDWSREFSERFWFSISRPSSFTYKVVSTVTGLIMEIWENEGYDNVLSAWVYFWAWCLSLSLSLSNTHTHTHTHTHHFTLPPSFVSPRIYLFCPDSCSLMGACPFLSIYSDVHWCSQCWSVSMVSFMCLSHYFPFLHLPTYGTRSFEWFSQRNSSYTNLSLISIMIFGIQWSNDALPKKVSFSHLIH